MNFLSVEFYSILIDFEINISKHSFWKKGFWKLSCAVSSSKNSRVLAFSRAQEFLVLTDWCSTKILALCQYCYSMSTDYFLEKLLLFVRYILLINVKLITVVTILMKMGLYRSQSKWKRSSSRRKWARETPRKWSDITQINSKPLQMVRTCPKSFLNPPRRPDLFRISPNPLHSARTCPKSILSPSKVSRLVPN